MERKFNTIEEAIEEIRNGKPIVIVDDEDRKMKGIYFYLQKWQHTKQ